MKDLVPLPAVYYPGFVADNQKERADNVLPGEDKQQHLETLRKDIRMFKHRNKLDKVIVLWTANTEKMCEVEKGVNDSSENILASIRNSHPSISPSTLYATASILEGCTYINGSPQNTFLPGVVELASKKRVFIGGDDFKSGQTKMKSVMVDFLISSGTCEKRIRLYGNTYESKSITRVCHMMYLKQVKCVESLLLSPDWCIFARLPKQLIITSGSISYRLRTPFLGIKPVCIASYNHLGNNDGKNLSSAAQFRSKEISKSNVVDDMVESNRILYKKGEKPDHLVVIKYLPFVRDSKRALDEYTSKIFMGGNNTIVMHNTCEDSLLASPLILDLVILAEFCERLTIKAPGSEGFCNMDPILSILSFMIKAPLVPRDTPVVNALFRQLMCIKNILRACLGMPPEHSMLLAQKMPEKVRSKL